MDTDLNTYLNSTAINQTITGNLTNTTFDFSLPPIEVVGMDVVLTFMIIDTVLLIVIMYYSMRGSWK